MATPCFKLNNKKKAGAGNSCAGFRISHPCATMCTCENVASGVSFFVQKSGARNIENTQVVEVRLDGVKTREIYVKRATIKVREVSGIYIKYAKRKVDK